MNFVTFIASLFNNNFLVNLAFIIELITCLFIFSSLGDKRNGFWPLFGVSLFAYIGLTYALSLLPIPDIFPSITSTLIYIMFIILVIICFKENVMGYIFLCSIVLTVQHGLMTLSAIISGFITINDTNVKLLSVFIIEISVFALGFFLVKYIIVKKLFNNQRINMIDKTIIVTALVMFLTIFVFYDYVRIYAGFTFTYRFIDFVLCFLSTYLISVELAKGNVQYEKVMMDRLMEFERKRYLKLEESMEQIKRKAHDLKYIEKAWNISKDNPDISKDYDENFDEILATGNQAIDNIVTDRSLYCKNHDITFTYIVDQSQIGFINDIDLMLLLGNILDNAIECVNKYQEKEKRIITLKISNKLDHVLINVDNYCEDHIVFKNGLPLTHKSDSTNHGFGIKTIKLIVDKYQGYFSIENKNHVFSLYISFPINKNSN